MQPRQEAAGASLTDTDNLARRSRGAKAGLVAAICVAIFFAAAGAMFLLSQIGNLKNDLASVRRELTGAKDRLARLVRKVDEPTLLQRFNDLAPKQTDERQRAPLELSRE